MSENTNSPAASSEGTVDATEVAQPGAETTQSVDEGILYADKFKSVSDLEKSYIELQSTFSKKLGAFEGAPESYTTPEGFDGDSTYDFVASWGKENNLSEKGLHDLVSKYRANQQAAQDAYIKSEIEKLGGDADIRIRNASDWVKANFGEDTLNDMNAMFPGARGIETIEKLQKMMQQGGVVSNAPTKPSIDGDQIKAMRFAKDEFGNRRMSVDPAYRAKVEALEAEFYSKQ